MKATERDYRDFLDDMAKIYREGYAALSMISIMMHSAATKRRYWPQFECWRSLARQPSMYLLV